MLILSRFNVILKNPTKVYAVMFVLKRWAETVHGGNLTLLEADELISLGVKAELARELRDIVTSNRLDFAETINSITSDTKTKLTLSGTTQIHGLRLWQSYSKQDVVLAAVTALSSVDEDSVFEVIFVENVLGPAYKTTIEKGAITDILRVPDSE